MKGDFENRFSPNISQTTEICREICGNQVFRDVQTRCQDILIHQTNATHLCEAKVHRKFGMDKKIYDFNDIGFVSAEQI